MKFVGVLITAVCVYALIVACVMSPGAGGAQSHLPGLGTDTPDALRDASTPKSGHVSVEGLPYRGVTIQLARVDWMDKYKKMIDDIAATGADTIKFVVDARMENGKSSRIYLDLRMTPTPEALGDLIQHAKKKNLRVILMPIVLLDAPLGNDWRGTIHPEFWNEWWESYRAMIGHYAWIAQANGVDVFVIGSELVSTESKVDEWTKTINYVRNTYKGRLTYSSNWDHYTSVPFWSQLDMIGMNSYWKMTDDDKCGDEVTLDDIKKHWQVIQRDLLPWIKNSGKPLLFLEIGWFSQRNTAYEPWDYTKSVSEQPIDLELQARLYRGFFESWDNQPLLGGYNIWEWTPGGGGPNDSGYTPENKPAERVMKEWFAKPAWKVKLD